MDRNGQERKGKYRSGKERQGYFKMNKLKLLKATLATILLIFVVVYGSVTFYYRSTQPELWGCKVTDTEYSTIGGGDITYYPEFYEQFNYPSCDDGYGAYKIPFWGFLYKYDLPLGLLMTIIGIILWYPRIKQLQG